MSRMTRNGSVLLDYTGQNNSAAAMSLAQKSRNIKNSPNAKIRRFDIKLDTDETAQPGLFTSGSTLSGHILLEILKPISIVRVRVTVEGLVRVTDLKKQVLSSTQILFGVEKGRKIANKFAPGTYTYPFRVELPPDLPTTIFKSQTLQASYRISAVLVRKLPSDDHIIGRSIILHHVSDDIYEQVAIGQAPAERSIQFNKLAASITLPRTGLFLGYQLEVHGHIDNLDSGSHRVKVGVKVCRKLIGKGEFALGLIKIKDVQNHTTVITDRWTNFFKIKKGMSQSFEVTVPLTLMEPSSKHNLIDIEYYAEVSFVREGVISDSKAKPLNFPITIAPPRSFAQYPQSYAAQVPLHEVSLANDLNIPSAMAPVPTPTGSLYPMLPSTPYNDWPEASAPAYESDEENGSASESLEDVALPSYEQAIAAAHAAERDAQAGPLTQKM